MRASVYLSSIKGFPGGSVVKNLPAMQETRVQSLGLEDPMEKEMATHSSIVALEIPWTEEPGGLQSMGCKRVMGSTPGSGRSPGGGNGNPLQYSCLKNPTDRGAWWAIVHGVTKE